MAPRPRVIVALPNAVEGAAVSDWLSANGFEPVYKNTAEGAAAEMKARPFALLIADAIWAVATAVQNVTRQRNLLVPTILIGQAADRRTTAVNSQTMYMTRPIEPAVLSCFVAMAFVDERPVRRSPRKAVQRFEATANSLPSRIVDVSVEGLRLEVPRDRKIVLPPYFAVRIPLVGVSVIARRMWTSPSRSASSLWCGASLAHNQMKTEEAWRAFVDSVPVVGDNSIRVTA